MTFRLQSEICNLKWFLVSIMRKAILSLTILFWTIIGLAGPGHSQPSLKVGALVPFTGPSGDSGRECAKGLLDAAKWINQKGGIFGRKLEILLTEDTSQPAETIAAYRKWNEADHILLLYLYSTETVLALLPHLHLDRIPALASSFPLESADPSKPPFSFTIAPTPHDLEKIALHFISEQSGAKTRKPKVVFVGSPVPANQSSFDSAKSHAKALGLDVGPDLWLPEPSRPGESLLSALSNIATYNPDFAYLSLTSREASSVLQEAKKIGLKTRWVAGRRAFDETLSAFEGVLGVQPVAPYGEDVPGMAVIREAHQKWHPFDSHSLSYVEGWATAQVIAEALGRSLPEQRLSRERVKGSLESFKDFVSGGLLPPITITSRDHRPSVESRIFVIRGGKISRHTGFISIGR